MDANTGKKLGAVIHDLAERQGLLMSIVDDFTLYFQRAGEGTLPGIPATAYDYRSGVAQS